MSSTPKFHVWNFEDGHFTRASSISYVKIFQLFTFFTSEKVYEILVGVYWAWSKYYNNQENRWQFENRYWLVTKAIGKAGLTLFSFIYNDKNLSLYFTIENGSRRNNFKLIHIN